MPWAVSGCTRASSCSVSDRRARASCRRCSAWRSSSCAIGWPVFTVSPSSTISVWMRPAMVVPTRALSTASTTPVA